MHLRLSDDNSGCGLLTSPRKDCFPRLKSQSHDIFDLWFFRSTVPLGPLIHGLKRFRIQIRIRGDNRLRSARHSAESSFFVRKSPTFKLIYLPWDKQDHVWHISDSTPRCAKTSAQCITARSFLQHFSFWLRAVLHRIESTPRYASLRGVIIARSHLYLRIRNHMQKSFSLKSVIQVGLIDEKNQRLKISWDCPFNLTNNKNTYSP
jgi:hypothetical protein